MADDISSCHVITKSMDTSILATVIGRSGSLDNFEDALIFASLVSDPQPEQHESRPLREVSLVTRGGWLNSIVQKLAETSGITGLEALYGGAGPNYMLVDDSWWRWTAVFSSGDDLKRIAHAIDALFAWSLAHVSQVVVLTMPRSEADAAKAIANPIAWPDASGYDRDCPCDAILFSYLHSVRALMLTAAEENSFVFSLVQN